MLTCWCLCSTCVVLEIIYDIFLEQLRCLRVCFRCYCLCSTCFVLEIMYDIFLEQFLCLRECFRCGCLCSTCFVQRSCTTHLQTNFGVYDNMSGLYMTGDDIACDLVSGLHSVLHSDSRNACSSFNERLTRATSWQGCTLLFILLRIRIFLE